MTDDSEHKVDLPTKRVKIDESGIEQEDEYVEYSPSEAGEGMFRQFLRNSSFHGLRYVFSSELKLVERLFWLAVVLTAFGFCCFGMLICWKRYGTQLVQIMPIEDPLPIWSIPFPAVTICGQLNSEITEDQKNRCLENGVALERFCEQVCWHNQCDCCKSLFAETRTENGACYTFNSLAASDLFNKDSIVPGLVLTNASKSIENWSLQDGYADFGVFLKYYPRPAVDLSEKYHLRLKLKFNESYADPNCSDSSALTVYLHSPVDFPYKVRNGIRIEPGQMVKVLTKPKVTLSHLFMRFHSPESTKCYFEGQRQLRFFRIYTQENCELECRTNYFLEKKQCVLAYMPREAGTKLCTNSYQSEDPLGKDALLLARTENFPLSKYFVKTCNCLPTCNQVQYERDVSNGLPVDGNFSEMVVSYREDYFYGSRRTVRFGLIDLVTNVGALTSLFLGISLITVVEMVYYCTLRPLLA